MVFAPSVRMCTANRVLLFSAYLTDTINTSIRFAGAVRNTFRDEERGQIGRLRKAWRGRVAGLEESTRPLGRERKLSWGRSNMWRL